MSGDAGLEVTGGVAGVAARHEELLALAWEYDEAAERMRGWAARGAAVLVDPGLLASGPLSPVTLAAAEAQVLAATLGPDGVGVESLAWEADAAAVRLTAGLLLDADRLASAGLDRLLLPLGLVLVSAPGWVPPVAGVLARLYPDGSPGVRPVPGVVVPASHTAPRSVRDLVEHLRQLSALSPPDAPARNGTFELQTLTTTEGARRHVLLLPGTDDMTTLPWTRDGDARDMGANLALVGGVPDDVTDGVLEALLDAGVGQDPVLVVGHSQGGMVAAALLARADEHGLSIRHAVTLGSPTGQLPGVPAGSQVLSLEHRGDVVPLLDGGANPDSVEQVTVTFGPVDDGGGRGGLEVLADRHGFAAYAEGASLVDASDHPSVRAQVAGLRSAGFLDPADGTAVSSRLLQVVREE
ncbi:MAG: alpha/beta fold hydrolase [Nocardioides sp.]